MIEVGWVTDWEAMCEDLQDENATLRAALEAVEWVYAPDRSIYADPGELAAQCPWCEGLRDEGGHTSDCQRQAALKP